MICRNPFVSSAGRAFGCGQCMPCRLNRRRVWSHRIMLEASESECNAFATLTYRDDRIPDGGSLEPRHLQGFLKRLRASVSPSTFRFFAVGEYGDVSERPHYHAALFGFPSCAYGQSRYSRSIIDCCHWCDLVRDRWGKGHVYLGTLEAHSAQYLAGYVTKKMTAKTDVRLNGRYPEFGRMSLRPGVGAGVMDEMASALLAPGVRVLPDVPKALRHGSKELPLGRYLTKRLRARVGQDEKAPQALLDEMAAEMRPLQIAARSSSENPSFKKAVIAAGDQRALNMEARSKIFKQRRSI